MMRQFIVLLSTIMCFVFFSRVQGHRLKQLLILSRHNIRTPLIENLQYTSTNEFPKWQKDSGYLTDKGVLLEEYMGEYFHKWFLQQEFFLEGCPEKKSIHVYANTKQRTKETAKAFVKSAFKGCNVTVYSIDSEDMDPVFYSVPLNTSEELKAAIIDEMQVKLNGLQLQESYLLLNKILNLNQSEACKFQNICDLTENSNDIVYKIGTELNIKGPLKMGNSIVDSFLMSYYEGMPLENVAWGQIKTKSQWNLLTRITKEDQNVRFNSTISAKEVARPLLNYMLDILERNNTPKFTLLVGHDSNLNPVIAALGFINKVLPGQHEHTPIGGKLVFQKIEDDTGKEYLKVDYVYLTFEQIRNGLKLSSENPPLWIPMQITNCSDDKGYCPWESFIHLLKNLVQ